MVIETNIINAAKSIGVSAERLYQWLAYNSTSVQTIIKALEDNMPSIYILKAVTGTPGNDEHVRLMGYCENMG